MPNKASAIDVYRAMTSEAGSGIRTMNIADDDLTVILDALKLAAIYDHPDWHEVTSPYSNRFRGSTAGAFAELYPEDV